MSGVEVIRRLHEHRGWVNARLRAAARRLSNEELQREAPIGQGSLWRTLLHLYAAEYVWLAALQGDADPLTPGDLRGKLPGNQLGEGAIRDLPELETRWDELNERWNDYLARLDDAALTAPVRKLSTSSHAGKSRETSAADVLLHLCTHAQYTAAQAVHMLRRLGATDLPDVMLITLARDQASGD